MNLGFGFGDHFCLTYLCSNLLSSTQITGSHMKLHKRSHHIKSILNYKKSRGNLYVDLLRTRIKL